QLQQLRGRVQRRLDAISEVVVPEQREPFEQLKEEIELYWEFVEPVFDYSADSATTLRSLREELTSRRESVSSILTRIGSVNEAIVEQRQQEIDAAQNELIRYTWKMTLLSCLLGLAVAGAAGYGNHRLRRQADQQRLQTERAEHKLRSLSSQLVHAQEQERRMISRELHDEVGQTLTALGIELGNLDHLRHGPGTE